MENLTANKITFIEDALRELQELQKNYKPTMSLSDIAMSQELSNGEFLQNDWFYSLTKFEEAISIFEGNTGSTFEITDIEFDSTIHGAIATVEYQTKHEVQRNMNLRFNKEALEKLSVCRWFENEKGRMTIGF